MLNLKHRKRAAAALSPGQSTLSVSWLGNQFRALAVHRGQVEAAWSSPEPVEGTHNFHTLIRRAAAETNYKGTTVSLVLAHNRLVHQLIEVPPAKGAALQKLVSRQAQQQNLFPGEAVWSAQPAESGKTAQRLLLNLFPKALLTELTGACDRAGLFLTAVMPVPALLQGQLAELPGKDDDVTVIAAETGDTTTVLVGRGDGRVLLSRTLAGTWNTNLARMALDLKRTVLFVNQQFAVNVGHVWLFGANAAQHAPAVQEAVQLPTAPSPTPWTENYWATELLRLSVSEPQNLVTREQQMAPQRRLAARVLAVASALILAVAAGVIYYLHRLEIRQQANLTQAEEESNQLQIQRRKLEELHADLARRRTMVGVVVEGRHPPLAAWFLAYLSEATPPDLVITNLQFQREPTPGQPAGPAPSAPWRLRLAGTLQPSTTGATPPPQALPLAVTAFTNRLKSGPFKVEFLAPPADGPGPHRGAPAPAATNLFQRLGLASPPPPTPSPATNPPPNADSFTLEGLVQP
jgi:hypothetical protein